VNQPLLIGTSGYSYPGPPPKGWLGAFYPEPKPKRFDELQYYSRIFHTVEINSTFYRPPSITTTTEWVKKTSSDFTFSLKLWQKFTHPIKIGRKSDEKWQPPTQQDIDQFRAGIEPIAAAGKLGALLLQYPTSFHCTPESIEQIERTLQVFYDYPKVVELRHNSWDERSGEIKALLEANRAGNVLIDEPKFSSSIRQGLETIGDIFYFRAHGRNAKAWWRPKESWERYDYLYTRQEIKKIAARIESVTSAPGTKKGFAFFNNHARANSAANAIMLSQELGLRPKSMPDEAMIAKFPELANLERPST
jgi:uncharacterized protein YecE (DUF72 family)